MIGSAISPNALFTGLRKGGGVVESPLSKSETRPLSVYNLLLLVFHCTLNDSTAYRAAAFVRTGNFFHGLFSKALGSYNCYEELFLTHISRRNWLSCKVKGICSWNIFFFKTRRKECQITVALNLLFFLFLCCFVRWLFTLSSFWWYAIVTHVCWS